MDENWNMTMEDVNNATGYKIIDEDFVLSSNGKITSINLFGGDMITYS